MNPKGEGGKKNRRRIDYMKIRAHKRKMKIWFKRQVLEVFVSITSSGHLQQRGEAQQWWWGKEGALRAWPAISSREAEEVPNDDAEAAVEGEEKKKKMMMMMVWRGLQD